jgi:hypothetical protein
MFNEAQTATMLFPEMDVPHRVAGRGTSSLGK